MPRRPLNGPAVATNRFRKQTAAFVLALAALLTQAGGRAASPSTDALSFSKGFLVKGNYVVGGVDMATGVSSNGFVTGTIPMSGVPANADILAAYLYWETISSSASQLTGAKFRGTDVAFAKVADKALDFSTALCWFPGAKSGTAYTMTMFRANVIDLLPRQLDANDNPIGRVLVNDTDLAKYGFSKHTVTLQDKGQALQLPQSAGATLFVIYRADGESLKKIVSYEGLSIQGFGATTSQTIRGFYKSSSTAKYAKMTHVVGHGVWNPTDKVWFDNLNSSSPQLLATNSLKNTNLLGRGWSNPSFNVTSLMPGHDFGDGYGETVKTFVNHGFSLPYDCLAWGAIFFSAAVEDIENDGIPDGLEDSSVALKDPDDRPLPDYHAMGASSQHKDLFLEVNAMWAPPGTTYGSAAAPFSSKVSQVTDSQGHTHMPTPEVLKIAGDALRGAPYGNADGSPGITAHFDVGDWARYKVPGTPFNSAQADQYLVPSGLARGGELIQEQPCTLTGTVTTTSTGAQQPFTPCQFGAFPGTVSYPVGLALLMDTPVADDGSELSSADEQACSGASAPAGCSTRRLRFDRARSGIFHSFLYGHGRGVPKSTDPASPDFSVPSGSSGVADYPGSKGLISLGRADDFVGDPFLVASTTLHELGHNLGLDHSGFRPQFVESGTAPNTAVTLSFEPNCKPNYLSVMNYTFQLSGLLDDSNKAHADYSRGANAEVDETFLSDGSIGALPYRTAWYAPVFPGDPTTMPPTPPTLGFVLGASPATRHCDGSPLLKDAMGQLLEVPMAPIPQTKLADPIDWNTNGDATNTAFSQDVNFDGVYNGNGTSTPRLRGANDWATAQLDQVGSGGLDFVVNFIEGRIIDTRTSQIKDYGGGLVLDLSGGVVFDFNGGRIKDFSGGLDFDFNGGRTVIKDFSGGRSIIKDFGGGRTVIKDFSGGQVLNYGGGKELEEATTELWSAQGNDSPTELTPAVVTGAVCDPMSPSADPTQCHRILSTWKKPHFGKVVQYLLNRVTGAVTGNSVPTQVGGGTTPPLTSQTDSQELPDGSLFSYFVRANFDDLTFKGSAPASVTAVNSAPTANADSYSVNQGSVLNVAAAGVLTNDTDIDSPKSSFRAVLVTGKGPLNGTLSLNTNGSFTYTPTPSFFGTDSFTYQAFDACLTPAVQCSPNSNEATATISVVPQSYGFKNWFNLPPATGVTFKAGPYASAISLEWKFTINGVVVNSLDALPSITIQGPAGSAYATAKTYTPGCTSATVSGCDSFRWEATDKAWDLHWKPSSAIAGKYYVIVRSGKTGQRFPATGNGFEIVLK